ncbi:transglutaminase domain-containing protein [Candidatus Woesebacteria bacterium]|nr:MAG: transglutaminase domain-containing protein [Candidatus Woesebacteria bacterium]
MLKNILLTLIALAVFAFPKQVYGDESFKVNSFVVYDIKEDGLVKVSHMVSIENLRSDVHAEKFKLTLESLSPENIKASQNGKEIDIKVESDVGGTTIDVVFDEYIVGLGKTREFTILYDDRNLAIQKGEIWEVTIPKLKDYDTFDNYDVELVIPDTWGSKAYISPEPRLTNTIAGKNVFEFGKEDVVKSGITAGFGKFQVFTFSLAYHLENPINKATSIDIALPPDNSIQRMYYTKIDPQPTTIRIDDDGNWLAQFELQPRQRLDVNVLGSVEIFAVPKPHMTFSSDTLAQNLKATQYWQSDNPEIVKLAKSLKTPEAIYNYVVNTLYYDYERVLPNVSRLGAVEALSNPDSAICMEFTDLFIALARAAGIPAREVNGYAYTENPEIEPLSLVADVLHSWPEYWDEVSKVWVPIDPTWGSTTGGVDYFTKLDLRHFAFVIHGVNDREPFPPGSYKLGPNPQKDVWVNFGQLPQDRENNLQIKASRTKVVPFLGSSALVTVYNPGPKAEYNLSYKVSLDDNSLDNRIVEVIPPFSEVVFKTKIPYGVLGFNTPDMLSVTVQDIDLSIPTYKYIVVIINLTIISSILLIFILILLVKMGKLKLHIIHKFRK